MSKLKLFSLHHALLNYIWFTMAKFINSFSSCSVYTILLSTFSVGSLFYFLFHFYDIFNLDNFLLLYFFWSIPLVIVMLVFYAYDLINNISIKTSFKTSHEAFTMLFIIYIFYIIINFILNENFETIINSTKIEYLGVEKETILEKTIETFIGFTIIFNCLLFGLSFIVVEILRTMPGYIENSPNLGFKRNTQIEVIYPVKIFKQNYDIFQIRYCSDDMKFEKLSVITSKNKYLNIMNWIIIIVFYSVIYFYIFKSLQPFVK